MRIIASSSVSRRPASSASGAARLLQQQLAHDQRAGRGLEGLGGILGRMLLHLARDGIPRDGDAVDAHAARLGQDVIVDRAAHERHSAGTALGRRTAPPGRLLRTSW
jgi:hypothetical protein